MNAINRANIEPFFERAWQTAQYEYDRQYLPPESRRIYLRKKIEGLDGVARWNGTPPGWEKSSGTRSYGKISEYKINLTSEKYNSKGFEYHWMKDAAMTQSKLADNMVSTMRQATDLPDDLVIDLLEKGETDKAFDKQNFFLSAPAGRRNYSNLLTGTGIGDTQLVHDLQEANKLIRAFKDDSNKPLRLEPDTVLCHPDLYDSLSRVLFSPSDLRPNINAGVFNVISRQGLKLIKSPRLTQSNDWYVLTAGQGYFPMYCQISVRRLTDPEIRKSTVFNENTLITGVQADIWAAPAFGFPFTTVKINN